MPPYPEQGLCVHLSHWLYPLPSTLPERLLQLTSAWELSKPESVYSMDMNQQGPSQIVQPDGGLSGPAWTLRLGQIWGQKSPGEVSLLHPWKAPNLGWAQVCQGWIQVFIGCGDSPGITWDTTCTTGLTWGQPLCDNS